ncbi:MAG: tRNA (N(6)-L-threonylcarbamoyladenosine(37)-C(2))-methylthiotransferase MtaB [Muribaculaceae bacterium]|nr:tRNA (N(6)-L-threonylcarbamoyladenosine(37)-C(2))-methylthiotransferase MtaB [Muribaculaceae bacterium]
MSLKASYHTLGCKLNFSETATIASMMEQKGILRAEDKETPDLCVVNTCSVTANADKKGRQLIRSLNTKYPEASIIVTGCYAQLKPEEVAQLPGVALVLGSNEKLRISQYLDSWLENNGKQMEVTPSLSISEFLPSCERGDRTRYFLKVQDGCDYFCTYCTIPFARGRSRSGSISAMVEMARDVARKGGKEIVITGVNIGTFGKDHGEDFFSLIKALDKVNGIERYRISSIEPNLLTDEIIEWIAKESFAFMPHFHIPLQSGSDKVLKLMNRRYDTALFASRIEKIRQLIPDAFIGVDIIAGARGETPEEWQKSYEFAKSLDVEKFHAFPYSERQGTKALILGESVPQQERYKRVSQLNSLSEEKTAEFIERNVGSVRKVLWEKPTGIDTMHGLTDNYIRVESPLDPNLINKVSFVEILSLKPGQKELALGRHINNV